MVRCESLNLRYRQSLDAGGGPSFGHRQHAQKNLVKITLVVPEISSQTDRQTDTRLYKCLHQAAPTYLSELCTSVSASASRSHLRSAARGDLAVPRSRTSTYGQRSFAVSGPTLWNSPPLNVRDSSLTLNSVLYTSEDCSVQ